MVQIPRRDEQLITFCEQLVSNTCLVCVHRHVATASLKRHILGEIKS